MRHRTSLPALLCLAALAGCGGGGSGGAVQPLPAQPLPAPPAAGPTLRAIVGRAYSVIDLGKIEYHWPAWFLSPGAGSIALNENGDVVSAYNVTPYVWTTTSLSQLNGRFTSARGLNNKGQVVGDTWPADSNQIPTHAAVWQNAEVTDLGTLYKDRYGFSRSYAFSEAIGINDAGQIVGETDFLVNPNDFVRRTHAFSYANGQLYDLGTLGGYYCRAVAVNNVGQAIGYGTTADNVQTHAISFQNGSHIDLGTLPGGTYSQANALNDAGQAVGFSNRPPTDLSGAQPPHAVVWREGRIVDIGTLGGPGSFATGVNKDGAVVGSSDTADLRASDSASFGYFYDYTTYYGYGIDLTINSQAIGIAPGIGSGFAGGGTGRAARARAAADARSYNVAHAFVYADGIMVDLNQLLPANSGWELTQAHAINARGQIVGIGALHGQVHGYFLDPR